MKKLITICLVCILTAAVSQGMTISFDENGHGYADGNSLQYYGGVGIGGPLQYLFPFPYSNVVYGDVVIYEPDASGQPTNDISDILRFNNWTAGIGMVYVYSDLAGAGELPELADTGFPTEFLSNMLTETEEGTEDGWNGLHYTPEPGQPGYMGYMMGYMPGGVTYIFTSDIPEPATMCLLGLGALALLRNRRFR